MYRALRADNHRLAIFGEGNVEEDNFTLGLGGSFFQVIKSADHQHLCRDALLWRTDAAAQAKHRQLAMTRSGHLGRLLAANPARHPDRLAPDILKPSFFISARHQSMASSRFLEPVKRGPNVSHIVAKRVKPNTLLVAA